MKLTRITLSGALLAALSLGACGGDGIDKLADDTQSDQTDDTSSGDTSSGDTSSGDTSSDDTSSGDTSSDDCGGVDLPAGYEGLLGAGGRGCDYLECLFNEMGVSNTEEFEEKFGGGDGTPPSPEAIGAITGALSKCGALLTPQS